VHLHGRIDELLDLLKSFAAFRAAVLVNGHPLIS
jgi:hypothetical protein